MVTKYYSMRNGKKVLKGYRARPMFGGQVIAERLFDVKEKTKAYQWHDEMIALAKKGYDQSLTLLEALELYLDNLKASSNGRLYAKKALGCLRNDVPRWMDVRVGDLKPTDISQLLEELDKASEERLGRKRAHLKREVEVLHAVFEYYKYSKNNDFENPVTPLHKKRWAKSGEGSSRHNVVVAHDEQQAKQLLGWLKALPDPVYHHVCLWQLTSHRQRIGEVLSLEWADIDWEKEIAWITGTMLWTDEENRTVRNFKQYHTKEGRPEIAIFFGGENIHLKQSLLELENLRRSKRWVFADEKGNVPAYRQVLNVYKRSGFFNEKFLGTHKCRKTSLTLGSILCGADMARSHGGHATWSAHHRYIDRHLTEMNNPVPAKIAEVLGLRR